MAAVKPAPEHGLVTVRQTLNDGMGPALPGRFDDSVQAVQRFDLAESDVLAGRQVIAHEVLKDDADSLPQVERVQLANIDAVDQYRALSRIVETTQEFDERRFAGAIGADQRDFLAGADAQVDVTQRPVLAFRVAKADAAKFDAAAECNRQPLMPSGNTHLRL